MLVNVEGQIKPKVSIMLSIAAISNALPKEWPRENPTHEEAKTIKISVGYNKNHIRILIPNKVILIEAITMNYNFYHILLEWCVRFRELA